MLSWAKAWRWWLWWWVARKQGDGGRMALDLWLFVMGWNC